MSDTPNLPINSRDLESATPESINNLFAEVFGIDVSLPDWASAPAEGNFFPSAQLCTRDGRVTGNAVLMWWTIVTGMPAAVVATDAGNVIIVTQAELEDMFYAPEFLMREPLYAHLAGVATADIEIPDEFRFLFESGGVPLDEDQSYTSSDPLDAAVPDNYSISITYDDGNTITSSFDTSEELNAFMFQMGLPFHV